MFYNQNFIIKLKVMGFYEKINQTICMDWLVKSLLILRLSLAAWCFEWTTLIEIFEHILEKKCRNFCSSCHIQSKSFSLWGTAWLQHTTASMYESTQESVKGWCWETWYWSELLSKPTRKVPGLPETEGEWWTPPASWNWCYDVGWSEGKGQIDLKKNTI